MTMMSEKGQGYMTSLHHWNTTNKNPENLMEKMCWSLPRKTTRRTRSSTRRTLDLTPPLCLLVMIQLAIFTTIIIDPSIGDMYNTLQQQQSLQPS